VKGERGKNAKGTGEAAFEEVRADKAPKNKGEWVQQLIAVRKVHQTSNEPPSRPLETAAQGVVLEASAAVLAMMKAEMALPLMRRLC
jgi:hypothetical protein